MKIAVVGLGYVGLSNAILLAQNHQVVALDVIPEKVAMINDKICPIDDRVMSEFLSTHAINLTATLYENEAFIDASFVVVATPTNYESEKNYFDTGSVIQVISNVLKLNPDTVIVIKSTIPVGFVDQMRVKYQTSNIMFSPEFLREGQALRDNLYPSRIIVGDQSKHAEKFANVLLEGAVATDVPILYTGTQEAEAIKLFANTYLAMRVAFFNELDSYAMSGDLDSQQIIAGVSLDPRIGDYYNNPSFGYGGYCLPKDTKQLLAHYHEIPQKLIRATVESNETRKQFLAEMILSKTPKVVGIYRLVMKASSDNFRESSIQDIMGILKKNLVEIVVFEPSLASNEFLGFQVISDISKFKETADLIIANRLSGELHDVIDKVFTRDLFGTS